MPDEEALRRRRALEGNVDRVHLGVRPGGPPLARRGDEEVEQPARAVLRPMDEHEAARSRPRERALRHPGCERGGDASVDGVAALLERPGAGLGGDLVPGGDRTPHADSVL